MLLMHKDIPVAVIIVRNDKPIGVNKIINEQHLPYSLKGSLEKADQWIIEWHSNRAIPVGRINSEQLREQFGDFDKLAIRSMGLSLTDSYWYKPEGKDIKWEHVDLHRNGFTPDLLLFKKRLLKEQGISPDYTTNGVLEKFWIQSDKKPFLLKSGDVPGITHNSGILAANEIIASKTAKLMNIPHAGYTATRIDGVPDLLCASECVIQDDKTDYVSALSLHTQFCAYDDPESKIKSVYQDLDFINEFMDMVKLDYILGNTDRHLSNFGIITDSDTTEILQPAPLYDSGACLGWTKDIEGQLLLRPLGISRNKIAEQLIGKEMPLESNIKNIVQETYESLSMPESYFHIALRVVSEGYELLSKEIKKEGVSLEQDTTDVYEPDITDDE